MRKKKILINTNAPWVYTGLAENGRHLAKYLEGTGKYEVVYYCQQVSVADPNHAKMPWKSRGCIPNDPAVVQRMHQDQNFARWVSYGNLLIEQAVKEEKPDIVFCSDDIWSFPGEVFASTWWKHVNGVFHVTVDSLPVHDMAYDQVKSTKNFFTWTKFPLKEIHKKGDEFKHAQYMFGVTDTEKFKPLPAKERLELRKSFGIGPNTTVFGYTFRNQLRKEVLNLLMAFRDFKKEFPDSDVKLHLHTSWSEKHNGWDIPKYIKYFGLNDKDVLCTYVCKSCKKWHVRPYGGEDMDCPYCKTKKSCVTPTIIDGVKNSDMKYLYAIRDATISPMTSGGLEYENVNSLLAGVPLATTNYSAGEDFCELPFVHAINWHPRFEHQSSFLKAANDVSSIKNFIRKIYGMSDKDRQKLSVDSREWAKKSFSIETIGPKWEAIFDAMPFVNWDSIDLTPKTKNAEFPMPQIENNGEWIKSLYNNILLVEPDPDGFKHWMEQLERGIARRDIYNFFIDVARKDNAKIAPTVDLWSLLDRESPNKRALMVIKESIGDILTITSLFESFHKQYPNHDLYISTEQKFHGVLEGNPFVKKALPYAPFMENEMQMIGAGQKDGYFHVFFHPAVSTQRVLSVLSADKNAFADYLNL